jgi:glycosyltransferase involved in cell wall biosynthesis
MIVPSRIVHVSSAHPASDPRIFEKECISLAQAGYAVHLVATGAPVLSPWVTVHIVARPASRLLRISIGSLLAILRALRTGASIVHLHDPELAIWIPLLRMMGRRVVFDSHEDIAASMESKEYLPARARGVATVMARLLVRFIDATVNAVVSATPEISRGYRHAPHAVIQNFPVLRQANMRQGSVRSQRLVYVGALSALRGGEQMIDALEQLATTHPGVSLGIAGDMESTLLERLREKPGWRHVDYRGRLARTGVNALLADADVGLVLFQPAPNHVASQPTKMFEYMEAGLPVVASDFPLWREFLVETRSGVVVDPKDPTAIAVGIAGLLDDPTRAAWMGQNGRATVEAKQNWESEARKLVDLYRMITPIQD